MDKFHRHGSDGLSQRKDIFGTVPAEEIFWIAEKMIASCSTMLQGALFFQLWHTVYFSQD